MEVQKSNAQLETEVREELRREHSINSDAIGITADHGLIFLSGHALGVTRRRLAEEAALRVEGVRAVIDELKVRQGRWCAHEADVAFAAVDSLKRLIGLPDGRVRVVVRDGKVHLKGTVSHPEDRDLIASTVRSAIGPRGVMVDSISIEPGASPRLVAGSVLPKDLADEECPATPVRDESRIDLAWPEDAMIVVDELLPDRGVSMKHVHHREFPEIRGEGETIAEGVLRLAHQLDRARDHAREAWQKEGIDHAILDLKAYGSSLPSPRHDDPRDAGDGIEGEVNQLQLPPVGLVVP